MDNFRTFLLRDTETIELNIDEFNNVKTNINIIDITIDLYGKVIYGFKTENFFYFERLNSYFCIPLQVIKNNINMTEFKEEKKHTLKDIKEIVNNNIDCLYELLKNIEFGNYSKDELQECYIKKCELKNNIVESINDIEYVN